MASYEVKASRLTMAFDNNTSSSITNIKQSATADQVQNIADAFLLLTNSNLKEVSRTISEKVKS